MTGSRRTTENENHAKTDTEEKCKALEIFLFIFDVAHRKMLVLFTTASEVYASSKTSHQSFSARLSDTVRTGKDGTGSITRQTWLKPRRHPRLTRVRLAQREPGGGRAPA